MPPLTVIASGSLLEGRIVSDGEVVVEAGAEVRAEIRARKVVVRGVVRGDVIATDLRLEGGGKVIGAVRTPAAEAAVAVAQAAASPKAARTPVTAAMADELAEAVAFDATRELTDGETSFEPSNPGTTGTEPGGDRRVVAVRRKG